MPRISEVSGPAVLTTPTRQESTTELDAATACTGSRPTGSVPVHFNILAKLSVCLLRASIIAEQTITSLSTDSHKRGGWFVPPEYRTPTVAARGPGARRPRFPMLSGLYTSERFRLSGGTTVHRTGWYAVAALNSDISSGVASIKASTRRYRTAGWFCVTLSAGRLFLPVLTDSVVDLLQPAG
jgi:hypothetical protein